jgi:hypothetical protein
MLRGLITNRVNREPLRHHAKCRKQSPIPDILPQSTLLNLDHLLMHIPIHINGERRK